MRYALIMAGGSGTRLWPMSRASLPKQLIPFIHGKSLLQLAFDRLDGLVAPDNRYICAGETHRELICNALCLPGEQFLAEPVGRDTLNAVGYSAAVIAQRDPEAVIAVFTADHIIEPVADFLRIVDHGFRVAEEHADTLVTFGIAPTHAATGYGYLQLGEPVDTGGARAVAAFKEKPALDLAREYLAAGAEKYLWNSGMFVWRAATLLECIRRYQPANAAGIAQIASAWETSQRETVLHEVFPTLPKISVDFAVMEPASLDPAMHVAAVPMPLTWLDVGSWPSFAETCPSDEHGNATAAKTLHIGSKNTLAASSDPGHLITTIGCEDLLIVHTPDATLVCHKDKAEEIKEMHKQVGERFGKALI